MGRMLPKSEGYNDPTQAAYWYQGMQSTHEKGHAFAAKIEDSPTRLVWLQQAPFLFGT